jgi:hypothetical protein
MFPTSCCNSREAAINTYDNGEIAVGLNSSRQRFGSGFSNGIPGSPSLAAAAPTTSLTVKDPSLNDCVHYSGTLYQRCLHTFLGMMFLNYVPIVATVASVYPCGECFTAMGYSPGNGVLFMTFTCCENRRNVPTRNSVL